MNSGFRILAALALFLTAFGQSTLAQSPRKAVIQPGQGQSFKASKPQGGQDKPLTDQDRDAAAKQFALTITAEDLRAHLNFLASDELEGRETATHGQKVAARYLATQFERMGLKPGNNGSWYQEYELIRTELNDVSISFDAKIQLKKGTDFIFFDKAAMAESFEAPLAFGGFGIADPQYDNLKGMDLKGKVVMIMSGEPQTGVTRFLTHSEESSKWVTERGAKSEALKAAGAAGIIQVQPDEEFKQWSGNPWVRHRMTGTSLELAYDRDDNLPMVIISESSANALLKKSKQSIGSLRNALNTQATVPTISFGKNKFILTADGQRETVIAENVLGLIEGTDKKEEIVVLTAHYDHLGVHDGEVFNGADDDGSGTAALLELAEAFATAAENGYRPRRTILIMPVSGEEKGLLGSQYYSDHPVFPLKNTVCNLNIDMIGRVDKAHEENPKYVYIIGSDKLSTDLHRINEQANDLVSNIELDYTYNDPKDPNRFYYRSDHYNFAKHGIPVIFYFTGVHADYHKATDTVDKIMFDKTAVITRLVFGTAWKAANRDQRLRVDVKNDFPSER